MKTYKELIVLRQDELQKIKDLEKQLYEAKNNQNWRVYVEDIYEKTLCEDDLFILKATYNVHHGFGVCFSNKTPKYHIYNVFGSYSFFNEWVTSIHNATKITDTSSYPVLENDFSNVDKVIKTIDLHLSNEYVMKSYEALFEFVVKQVKIMLGELS